MFKFYCIAFVEYMITGKTLLDYSNIFSPNDYQKNDKIIYNYFQDQYGKRKRKPWLLTKKMNGTRKYLLHQIRYNKLMKKKHKKVYRNLNYFEHFLIAISAVSGCVSISSFP